MSVTQVIYHPSLHGHMLLCHISTALHYPTTIPFCHCTTTLHPHNQPDRTNNNYFKKSYILTLNNAICFKTDDIGVMWNCTLKQNKHKKGNYRRHGWTFRKFILQIGLHFLILFYMWIENHNMCCMWYDTDFLLCFRKKEKYWFTINN